MMCVWYNYTTYTYNIVYLHAHEIASTTQMIILSNWEWLQSHNSSAIHFRAHIKPDLKNLDKTLKNVKIYSTKILNICVLIKLHSPQMEVPALLAAGHPPSLPACTQIKDIKDSYLIAIAQRRRKPEGKENLVFAFCFASHCSPTFRKY